MSVLGKIGAIGTGAALGAGASIGGAIGNVITEAGKGFLQGAIGRTAAAGFAAGTTGAKASPKASPSTGGGDDQIRAIRDLQSDFADNKEVLKDIQYDLAATRETLGNIGVVLVQSNMTLGKILDKLPGTFEKAIGNAITGALAGAGIGAGAAAAAAGAAGAAALASKTNAAKSVSTAQNLARGVGSRLPLIGGALSGGMEYAETGNLAKSLLVGGGSFLGTLAGGAVGSVVGPAGTIAGGIGGSFAGEGAGRWLYDTFFGSESEKMAELAKKEEEKEKEKEKKEGEAATKDTINFSSKEIVFKADNIKFDVIGAAGAATSSFSGSNMSAAPSGTGTAPGGTGVAPAAAPGGTGSGSAPGGSPSGGAGSGSAPAQTGFSPATQAAAAQASIATRGRFLNQGQFGPNLPSSSTPGATANTAAGSTMEGFMPPTEPGASAPAAKGKTEEEKKPDASMVAGSTMEGFMPPTAPEAAAPTAPSKPSKEYAEQKIGPQGGARVRKPAATKPAAPSGPSQDEVRKLWERYNETGSPADFVRADKAMMAMQAAQAAAGAAGKVVAQGGRKAAPKKAADLGPASMYGESDAEYRSRIATQEAAAKEGAPGYEGVAGKILTQAQQREKDLEAERIRRAAEEESKDDAERIRATSERAKLVQDQELEKGAAEGKSLAQMRQEGSGAAMTIRNALRGRDLTSLSERRADVAEGSKATPGESMDAELVGGVTGFNAKDWNAAYRLQRATDAGSSSDMGFGAGGAALNQVRSGEQLMSASTIAEQQFREAVNRSATSPYTEGSVLSEQPPTRQPESSTNEVPGAMLDDARLISIFGFGG